MGDHEKLLAYLLKILGSTGRNTLKVQMMGRVGGRDDMAPKLLNYINKLERAFGELDHLTPEERERLGWPKP